MDVRGPDGKVTRFPDGTPDETVHAVMGSIYPAKAPPMSLGDVASGAFHNAVPSAAKLAGNLIHPILHPIDTAKAIGEVGASLLGKMGVTDHSPAAADAVGKYFADRYGGIENLKHTLATDPAGLAFDASTVLTGGGSAAARLPGIAGKIGEAAVTAGRAINPVTGAAKVIAGGAKLAAPVAAKALSVPLGMSTGAGHMAVENAAKAGFEGGSSAHAFQANMRGNVPIENVVTQARGALANMRDARGKDYRAGMAQVSGDPTTLDFAPIDKAVSDVKNRGFYKGKVIDPSAATAWQHIDKAVSDWKGSDPAQFHTPEGLDALKRNIGNIAEGEEHGTPGRNAADAVYHAVKDQIVAQAPVYGKTMGDYEQASSLLKEIEQTLSLKKNANVDTSVRKLQSIMRNNANTNYGKRASLAEMLASNGAPNLVPSLAGQSLSAAQPRGLAGSAALLGSGAAAIAAPHALAGLVATSPRIVGEASYYAGKAAKAITSPLQTITNIAKLNPKVGAALMGALPKSVAKVAGSGKQLLNNLNAPNGIKNPAVPHRLAGTGPGINALLSQKP